MDLYYFTPSAHNADSSAFEYEGTKIGVSNTITSIRSEFVKSPSNHINVDEIILEKMFAHIKSIEEKEKVFLCDVIIHGVRVRLTTTSRHISEFFTDNFYNPREYSEQAQELGVTRQGSIVPFKVNVYVINGIFDGVPLYCYNTSTNSIYIFNCSFYKVVYDLVIEAAAKILREDRGFLIEKATTIEKCKSSVAFLGCNHSGSECEGRYCSYCYRLAQSPNIKLLSLNYTAFRFTFKNNAGDKNLSPIKAVMPDGSVKKGAEVLEFMAGCVTDENQYIANLNTVLSCLTPSDEKIEVLLSGIDIKKGCEIFSYPIFKNFYQKTVSINYYPAMAYQFLHSRLENVPEVTQEYMLSNAQKLEEFVRGELRGSKDASIAKYFNSISEEDGKKYVARFSCFEESYVLIDMAKIFGKVKIISNPFEHSKLKGLAMFCRRPETVKLDSAVFLKQMPDERKNESGAPQLLKTAATLCGNNISFCELNIYDSIDASSAGENFNDRVVYEESIKKIFAIEEGGPKTKNIVDGTNYKSLFPPPPPPKS